MARVIDSVVGHVDVIDSLISLKNQDRWPHAFLFVGAPSIGKKKVAHAFAQILICKNSDVACGECGPCLRVEKMQSENLIYIEPDSSLAKPVIKVEAIRSLLDSLSLQSEGTRVVIINDAHTMNPQAANALLKTLEEPFENVYFFLIGPDIQQFLPTIRSRSQVMQFHRLSASSLRKIKPGLSDWAYEASRGQVDRLMQLTSPEGVEKRTESYEFLEQFFADNEFLFNGSWRLQAKDKSWSLAAISSWLQIIGQGLNAQATGRPSSAVSIEHMKYMKLLEAVPSEKLLTLADSLVQAEREILGNADPVLIFEKMWVEYARVG